MQQLLVPLTTGLPEVTAHGLVLWRLRRSPEEQLWCSVRNFAGELTLVVQDPAAARTAVAEPHPHIASLVGRAETLRDQLIAAGWQMVDVDLDEPD